MARWVDVGAGPTMTKVTTISLNGHPTWVRLPRGKGPMLVLLHGGMSSSASLLKSIGPSLAKRYRVAAFDRRGHGRTADTEESFSYDAMASETIAFIEHLKRRVSLIGHSDGGNVALIVAMRRPDLLRRIVVIGANYHFEGLMPVPSFDVESDDFAQWAQRFGENSPDGPEHARAVEEKTRVMTFSQPTLTTQDLATIPVPTLVMAGDDDVATLAHTCSMYEAIPEAQLAIVPGTSHMLLKERTNVSVRIIEHFLRSPVPPVTYAPMRRENPETRP
jgi:pimeloyl-ACP methyl ester carboxylesterase